MTTPELQRRELERAIELLGRSTRPGRLLVYLGEKYFAARPDQITESKIAADVFGRSEESFHATQDAVVRVEVHRLRKKLRELYESGGGPDGLRVELPPGTYVLHFATVAAPSEVAPVVSSDTSTDSRVRPEIGSRTAYALLAAGLLGASILAAVLVFRPAQHAVGSAASIEQSTKSRLASNDTASDEIHLIAGYSGGEIIDSSGVRWSADRFFSGGAAWPSAGRFIRGTSRPFLFAHWRNGEFRYDIPARPGAYELRLYFVSPQRWGDEKISGFNISLNGEPLLVAFDINVDAPGVDVAVEKVFRDVSPDKDGFIRLSFTNQVAQPWLNAIEITPGIPGKLRPIRITTQATSFVDHQGQRWRADDYFLHGFRSTDPRPISGADDPELFTMERYGNFSYAIPVDTRDRYTVILHFVEFYFGPQLPGGGGVGRRVFHVSCNGKRLLESFDPFEEGGSLHLVSKTFSGIRPNAQGKIHLDFEPVVNNATVSGIEVIDEGAQ